MSLRPHDLRVDRLYSRASLLRGGMHRRHFASEAMRRVFPGWWARADAGLTLQTLAGFFLEHVRPGAVLSHQTAAELMGLPLPRPLTHALGSAIHCRGPDTAGRTAGALIVAHQSRDQPLVTAGGLVMAHPLFALQDIASRLSHIDLVVAMDALAADQFGARRRVTPHQMGELIAGMRGRGAPALRQALPQVRDRSWSPMETKLRLQMLRRGFPEPALNVQVIESATGSMFYIDLAYPEEKIAIEYDSEEHRKNRELWQRDLNKTDVLHEAGWKVLRATIADHRRPQAFFARLWDALERRRVAI